MSSRDHRARWDKRYASQPLVWSTEPNATVAQRLENTPPGRALDLACGEGRNALWLAERGWQVTAVDFSSVALEKASRIALDRNLEIDWRNVDLEAFEPTESHFDLVLACFVHTSSRQRREWLGRATRAVAPGGRFLYLGHDPRNPEEGFGGPRDLDVLPSADELCRQLQGFEIEAATTIERPVGGETGHGNPGATGVALDTWVVAIKRCAL